MDVGKQFEADIKKSISDNVYYQRIYDQTFDHTSTLTRFTKSNPFDSLMYANNTLYLLELKSTKQKSISIQTEKKEKSKMIKLHQIVSLTNANKFFGIVAGFLFNFRLDENHCFFLDIEKFNEILQNSNKKSINIDEVSENGIGIYSKKLKVNYKYDITTFITDTCIKFT